VKAMADDVPDSAGPTERSWTQVRWLVRIVRNDRYILNRKYKTIEEAIAARDETLTTGRAPPGRAVGGPRDADRRLDHAAAGTTPKDIRLRPTSTSSQSATIELQIVRWFASVAFMPGLRQTQLIALSL
jgi:hypothetical protein